MENYNKELCDERHGNIEKTFSRLFDKIDKVANKLNWFYVITIATLALVIANLFK